MTHTRYTVSLAHAAARDVRKLPRTVQQTLAPKLEALADEPRPRGAIKLSGETDTYRLRVGNYRVLDDINDAEIVVLVLRIRKRDERTYK